MTSQRLRGVFPIPVTPFNPDLTVDTDSLRSQVRFCLAAGSHGIVYPGVVSEFFALDEAERTRALGVVLEQVGGRIPVLAGVSATSAPIAARLTAAARERGADGYMATLPYVQHFFSPDLDYAARYFGAIEAEGGGRPIVLQNARIGHPVPLRQLPELIRRVPTIRYIKQETSPPTHELSAAIQAVGSTIDGVFAGLGGIYLMSELRRGAAGSMPAPPFVDALVRVWDAGEAGRADEARRILSSLGALFTYELTYNVAVIKEILRRRGVIAHTACRVPVPALDPVDARELDELLTEVAAVLRGEVGATAEDGPRAC